MDIYKYKTDRQLTFVKISLPNRQYIPNFRLIFNIINIFQKSHYTAV